MIAFGFTVLVLWSVGCSSSSASNDPFAESDSTVACRQKDDADSDDDCSGHSGKPRKLDCDSDDQVDEAVAAGCEPEKEGSNDVCCPKSVGGQKEAEVECTEPLDTMSDSDCMGTDEPRKLSCSSSSAKMNGLDLGCRSEDPSDTDDNDLCCPTHVRGSTRE